MVPMMLQQIVGQKAVAEEIFLIHVDLPRIADTIHDFLYAVRSPDGTVSFPNRRRHEDQLYLSEYVAHKARQLVQNINLDVEARNTVAVQAAKLKDCTFEGGGGLEDDRVPIEFEDVGGACGDDIEDPAEKPDRSKPRTVSDRILDLEQVTALLCREEEAQTKGARTTDAKQNMRNYVKAFGSTLNQFGEPIALMPRKNRMPSGAASQNLALQRARAETQRRNSGITETGDVTMDAEPEMSAAPATVSRFTVEELIKGPAELAW